MEGISEDHLAQSPVLTNKAKEAGISYWPIENKNNIKCAMKRNYVNYFVDGGYIELSIIAPIFWEHISLLQLGKGEESSHIIS